MHELTALNTADYLRDSGRIPQDAEIRVRELSGGVSNIVLRVDVAGRPPFVIKQCRERLRVAMEWHARLDRIWTESATLGVLRRDPARGDGPPGPVRGSAELPLRDDLRARRRGHLEVPVDGRPGSIPAIAGAAGYDPGHDPRRSPRASRPARDRWPTPACSRSCGSIPITGPIARRHPDLAPRIEALIAAMDRPDDERTLVLGDFSPKNILVHAGGLILLDFECAHAGDPAFDLGFFLTHLLLKEIRAASRTTRGLATRLRRPDSVRSGTPTSIGGASAPEAEADLIRRANRHTAACCLARVDGKSPVEYLDARGQALARSFAREALRDRAARSWDEFMHLFRRRDGEEAIGMATLKGLKARQVLDSRGRPTVEVEAIAPSGAVRAGDRPLGGQHGPSRGARAARRR